MLSDRSRQSSDGLSWAGSFIEPFDDDELLYEEERQDRMSSSMAPGGRKYEKGKWVSSHERLKHGPAERATASRISCFAQPSAIFSFEVNREKLWFYTYSSPMTQ